MLIINLQIFVLILINKGFKGYYYSISFLQEEIRVAYFITDTCISCGACELECPVNCIYEGHGKYIIDSDICIECGTCDNICPVDAPQKK